MKSLRHSLVGLTVFIIIGATPLHAQQTYDVEDAEVLWTEQYGDRLVRQLERAREEIYVMQYLVMGRGHVPKVRKILDTLQQKAREGVRVIIVADGSREGDYGNPINSMLRSEFDTGNVDVTVLSAEQVMHSKVVIIDRTHSFIGSQNWTKSGLADNVELAVHVHDEDFSSDLRDQLEGSYEEETREPVLRRGEKSINEVNRRELTSIPTIGPHFAEEIVIFRRRQGKIRELNKLREIPGIGDDRFDVLRNYFSETARQRYREQHGEE